MESCSIIVRGIGSKNKSYWFKEDVTTFVNGLLQRIHGRLRNISHNHTFGTSNSAVFKQVTLLEIQPHYRDNEPPSPFTRSATIKNSSKVYCVGGNSDIRGFRQIMSERRGGCSEPVTEEREITKNNMSHRIVEINFGLDFGAIESYFGAPLVSPRFCPKVVSIRNNVYLFGGNCPPSSEEERSRVPFAEVFDPVIGECSPLPEMPYPRIGEFYLIVVPFLGSRGEDKILIMSRALFCSSNAILMAVYDTICKSWTNWTDPGGVLFNCLCDISGEPVAVRDQNSTYWLRGRFSNPGKICCYDWKKKQIFQGTILHGFENDEPIYNFQESLCKHLLHIIDDLFCLIWCEIEPRDGIRVLNPSTHFHFSFLLVHKKKSSDSSGINELEIQLVGCQNNIVEGIIEVVEARCCKSFKL